MRDEIKIDKGIPAPSYRRGAAGVYPWKAMEVGDSFFAPGKGLRFQTQASRAGKAHGRKFTTRTVEGGVRVWRVA